MRRMAKEYPTWFPLAGAGVVILCFTLLAYNLDGNDVPHIKVAMIGNSMQYYNDLPRFLEDVSDGHITQNSCLHGNANFETILTWGNGMYNIWDSGASRIFNYHRGRIHDYGACTVKQLLFGYDEDLDTRVQQLLDVNAYTSNDDDDAYEEADDDNEEAAYVNSNYTNANRVYNDDEWRGDVEKAYGDDFFSYYDGSNPCLRNPYYYNFLQSRYSNSIVQWDYIVMNDNTRHPARNSTRHQSLQVLNDTYIPWILATNATPVLLATYGYWTPYRDMGGLGSIPEFTSLTHEGYQEYADLLEQYLPESQKPRIAPVGVAFLMVWEENFEMWERLFHVDKIHCSPMGTYLEGLVVYYTLMGRMPPNSVAVRPDMSSLWTRTRRFQPGEHRRDPFPTKDEASYLYNVATRVMVYKHVPKSFLDYQNGEAVDYEPMDDLYKMDDLF